MSLAHHHHATELDGKLPLQRQTRGTENENRAVGMAAHEDAEPIHMALPELCELRDQEEERSEEDMGDRSHVTQNDSTRDAISDAFDDAWDVLLSLIAEWRIDYINISSKGD